MQTRLVLIRHGQVEADWQGRIYGSHEVSLSELGMEQANEAAVILQAHGLAAVICSPLTRARYGAHAILQGRSLECIVDDDLREIDRGAWIGASIDELGDPDQLTYAGWMRNPAQERPAGGESLQDLATRVFPRFDHWADRYAGQVIAIVAHSWVIRIAICEALGLDLNRSASLQLETGAMAAVEWSPQRSGGPRRRCGCLVGMGLRELPPRNAWFAGKDSACP